MFSLITMLSAAHAELPPVQKCATLERLQHAPPLLSDLDVPPPRKNGKQERDSTCPGCNTLSSDNFIVRWGSGVSQSEAQTVLDSFEYAWDIEVGQMGYDAPTSSDTYLFNIYITFFR